MPLVDGLQLLNWLCGHAQFSGLPAVVLSSSGSEADRTPMTSPPELVDIGVNLTHRSFQPDRQQVVERAFAAGVRTMIVTGTDVAGSRAGITLAAQYPGRLFATAGVHPHDSRHCTESTIPELRQLATTKEVVAIGECGLDFN